jgi:hypothetical protein
VESVNADDTRSGTWLESLTWSKMRNMNANLTPGKVSEFQLLTWSHFADLCGDKSFHCNRLVEAGGVEPPSEKRYGSKPTCLAQFHGIRQPRSE